MTSKSTLAWNDYNNFVFELSSDGCVEDFPCIRMEGFTDVDGRTLEDLYCKNAKGELVKLQTVIQQATPERVTMNISGLFSEMFALDDLYQQVASNPDCFPDARIAVYCNAMVAPENLVGWIELPSFDPGVSTFGTFNDGNGTAPITGGLRETRASSFSGRVRRYRADADNMTIQGYQFAVAGQTPVAVVQCDGAVCKTGADGCGNPQTKRGACDHWTLYATDGTDTYVYESSDGGKTYDTANPTVLAGVVVNYADCDSIVTNEGPLEVCGDSYVAQDLPLTFDATGGAAGQYTSIDGAAPNALLYSNGATMRNGVMVFESGDWVVSYEADTALPQQNHIDSDEDGNVITGGTNDGLVNGAWFNIFDGSNWSSGVYNDPAWSTAADEIVSVNVRDGVYTMQVSNGTDIRTVYSLDGGNNWIVSDSRVSTAPKNELLRPTDFVTWRHNDEMLWTNFYGVCECKWVQQKELDGCPAAIGVCADNPFYVHYIYQ